MATEFPTLGQHCAHLECGQLDFLPIKCYGCSKMFCSGHYTYESHECPSELRTNVQVPVCPLCNQPVPVGKNQSADNVVGRHIDNDCQSSPAQRKRVYVNQCSLKRCKGRELVPIHCDKCRRNFCIKHRHFGDHACTGLKPNPELRPAPTFNSQSQISTVQKRNTDEELARALHKMLNKDNVECSPEEMDRRLAMELQNQEYNDNPQIHVGGESSQRKNCCIS